MKKKFLLLLLTFVFVLSFSAIAFADVTYKDKDGKEIITIPDIPEEYQKKLGSDYVVYFYDWGGGHRCVRYCKGIPIMLRDGCYQLTGADDELIYSVEYDSATGGYNVPMDKTFKSWGSNIYKWSPSKYVPIYATANIMNYDGTVFFQPPKTPELTAVVTRKNLGGVLGQVVSLIPLGLSAIVLYLALRKALSFVLARLRTA